MAQAMLLFLKERVNLTLVSDHSQGRTDVLHGKRNQLTNFRISGTWQVKQEFKYQYRFH